MGAPSPRGAGWTRRGRRAPHGAGRRTSSWTTTPTRKVRAQYLPLELAVAEAPQDATAASTIWSQEYLYHRRWDDCIRTLTQLLTMPSATWADERAGLAVCARSYEHKGQPEASLVPAGSGGSSPSAEPLVELALLLYTQEEWEGVLYFAKSAGHWNVPHPSAKLGPGALPYGLRCQAYYRPTSAGPGGCQAALALEPQDERLQRQRWGQGGAEQAGKLIAESLRTSASPIRPKTRQS